MQAVTNVTNRCAVRHSETKTTNKSFPFIRWFFPKTVKQVHRHQLLTNPHTTNDENFRHLTNTTLNLHNTIKSDIEL